MGGVLAAVQDGLGGLHQTGLGLVVSAGVQVAGEDGEGRGRHLHLEPLAGGNRDARVPEVEGVLLDLGGRGLGLEDVGPPDRAQKKEDAVLVGDVVQGVGRLRQGNGEASTKSKESACAVGKSW